MPKARKDMDPRYQWDLTPIYPTDADWETDLKRISEEIKQLDSLPGTLAVSVESLKSALDTVFSLSRRIEKLYNYAELRKAGDNSDAQSQDMEARCVSVYTDFGMRTSFLRPEILAMDEATLKAYASDERMRTYRHYLEDIARGAAHTQDAKSEALLARLNEAAQTPANVFGMFESVDLTFDAVTGSDGEALPLSHGTFGVYRVHPDRNVRRDAFEKYFGAFEHFIHTLAAVYDGSVKLDCYGAGVRGYASACESALFDDNVPTALYDNLVREVGNGLDIMKRYLKLRKDKMGVDELHLYDLYVPIVDDVRMDMSYDKACALVREALRPLGDEYAALLEKAMNERWIDVYENAGKTTGAFSEGVFDAHPYVLLNFSSTLDDAFTLAHELGHSMHSWFSDHAQDYANHSYSIFVAEVASTVNEVLLTMHLLKTCTDPREKAYVLNHFLEGFRTTVFRQTQFAEFERRAHEMYEAGETLTAQALNALYRSLNEKYYPGVQLEPFTDVEWARIPHFYRAFYVYQYATGFCSAVSIADRILNHGGTADYLKFLTTGGSDYPIEELKIAGVDLTRPEAIGRALKVFSDSVDELAGMLDQ